ncbi:MAG: glycosyltransferase family 4 protein [Acidobacteria bacterium]|nr:glycosyltransferase family 4 protein [Acidobacteriota bacterium]
MRIGIDCSELSGKPTGVGRFLRVILAGLAQTETPHQFSLYGPEDIRAPEGPGFVVRHVPRRSRKLLQEQLELPRLLSKDGVDLFYTPGYWLPLRARIPSIFTLHDVSFVAHPEWFSTRERLKRITLSRLSARKAVAVFTVSEFSRTEILRHYRLPPERVLVAKEGVDPDVARGGCDVAAFRSRLGLSGPLILSVGSLFQRRRTDVLLQAFSDLSRRHPEARLWVAGENRTHPKVDYGRMAAKMGIGHRVFFGGYTQEATVRQLYQAADLLVFLSEYEGFGLPPLEACACGLPVVSSRGSSLEEIFRDHAMLVDARDPKEIADAMDSLLSDPARRRLMRSKGLELAAAYSAQAAAAKFLSLIGEVMGSSQ